VVRRLGCDEAQGYHIARPMPPESLAALRHEPARVAPLLPLAVAAPIGLGTTA
jgi:predicted signal transduction protein with EAL and GGDEF domain